MLADQRPFAAIAAVLIMGVILYLVRKKKLREEYAILWVLVGAGVIALALWYDLVLWLSKLIGAVDPTSTLFIFSLIFLLLLSIHYSISLSRLKDQVKDLTQEIAILRSEREEDEKQEGGRG